MVWIAINFMADISEGLINPTHTSYLKTVFSLNLISVNSVNGIPIPLMNLGWFSAAYNLATFNYWFFEWPAGFWVRHLVGLPITAMFIWGIQTTLMPILIQAANVLVNLFIGLRGLLGGVFGALGRLILR